MKYGQPWWSIKNAVPALAASIVFFFCFFGAIGLTYIVTESEAILVAVGVAALVASIFLGGRISDRLGEYMAGRSSKFPYLDTPDKRTSFVVFVFGLILAGIGVLFHPHSAETFLRIAFEDPPRTLMGRQGNAAAMIFWVGVGISLLGAIGIFGLYAVLLRWIRSKQ